MNREYILTTIADTVLDVTGISPDLVTMGASFEALDIDSLFMVTILVELEEALGVNLVNEIGNPETVSELVDFIFDELNP